MNDFFAILMHYVKQYFSKLSDESLPQDNSLFSEQILVFLEKSITYEIIDDG